MDFEIELFSSGLDNDWSLDHILDSIPTPPSSPNSPHAALHEPNLTIPEQQQQHLEFCTLEIPEPQTNVEPFTELAAALAPVQNLVGPVAATENQVQTSENPALPTLVGDYPNPLPQPLPYSSAPVLNETQPGHLSSSPVEESIGIGTGHSSAQFITNQRSPLPPENHINSNPRTAWSSSLFSASNVYEAQYAMQSDSCAYRTPQSLTTLQHQLDRPSKTQKIFDLQSQYSMWPFNPMYLGSEPYSHLQSEYVRMTPKPYVHQHGYTDTPMQPEPTAPSVPPMYSDCHLQPSPYVTTYNSFGSGCSLPLKNSPLYDNQSNHYYPQTKMPNGHGQQGVSSMHFTRSQKVNGYNHNTWTTEGLSSQVFSSRAPEIERPLRLGRAPAIQLHQVASASANEYTRLAKGKLSESSRTRARPSEAIQRILNMSSKRRSFNGSSTTTTQQNQSLHLPNGGYTWRDDLGKQQARNEPDAASVMFPIREEGHYGPPHRGRPSKPLEEGESSKRQKKETGNAGTTPSSQEADKTPENVGNEDQNANPSNLFFSAQSSFKPYDPAFAMYGVPVDPYLRRIKAQPEK